MNAPVAPVRLQPDFAQRPIPEAFLQALAQRFGAQCSTALAVREQHGRDEGAIQAPPPAAVVFAESTQDVQDALKLADQHAVPVIPYGAGSSLEGHLLAVEGGISLDLSRMNRILSVNAEDLTVTVQPGITRKQLNDADRKSTRLNSSHLVISYAVFCLKKKKKNNKKSTLTYRMTFTTYQCSYYTSRLYKLQYIYVSH